MEFEYTLPWDREGRLRPRTEIIRLDHPDPDDLIARQIRNTRCFYEVDLLEYVAVRGPSGGIFIDIGANIGNHSVYFGKFLADFVVSIEPTPRAADALERNLAANGISAGRVFRCGLGAAVGSARASTDASNLGATQLLPGKGDIDLVRLDDLVDELPDLPVRLLKIDVEGMEMDVLAGARQVLTDHKPQCCVELKTAEEYDAAQDFLAEFGYETRGCFCASPTYVFAHPLVHPRRHRPWWPLYRIVKSWRRGALSRYLRRST